MSEIKIKPQEGQQEAFLSTPVDIAFYGGAAGGGKTHALLMEPLRHSKVKGFNGTIFRRTREQIRNTGALWDSASELYSLVDANLRESSLRVSYQEMNLKFSHLEYEKDKFNWDGSQICYLAFDELQSFTITQFWYLIGRTRSICGVTPYVRATCMADADSWVKEMILWWLDKNGEYPDIKKSGVIRWFVRIEDDIEWADSKEFFEKKYPEQIKSKDIIPLSFTFIYSDITENKILMEKDPSYLAKLNAMPLIERERKKKGNWKIKPQAGLVFKREWFEIVDALPAERAVVRFWDRAATEKKRGNNPAATAGVKMSIADGIIYVEHVSRFFKSVHKRDIMIKNTASGDTVKVQIGLEREPGASGIAEVQGLIKMLVGFNVHDFAPRDNKMVRTGPFASQAEAGNVKILRGNWNDVYLTELENCDGDPKGKKKWDQIDGSTGAFEMLTSTNVVTEHYNVENPELKARKDIDIEEEKKEFRGEFGREGRDRLI